LIDWIGVNIKIVCADMQMSLCKDWCVVGR